MEIDGRGYVLIGYFNKGINIVQVSNPLVGEIELSVQELLFYRNDKLIDSFTASKVDKDNYRFTAIIGDKFVDGEYVIKMTTKINGRDSTFEDRMRFGPLLTQKDDQFSLPIEKRGWE